MIFQLSNEEQALSDTVLRVVNEHAGGRAARRAVDGEQPFDAALWAVFCDLGLAGVAAPEAAGGLALDLVGISIIADALGTAAAPVPFLGHTLAVLALALAGSPAQQEAWLPKLASGELLGAAALEEHGAIAEPGQWSAAFARGQLSGEKINVECAPQAGLLVVGCAGGGLAIVPGPLEARRCTAVDVVDRTRRIYGVDLAGIAAEPMPGGAQAAGRLCDAAHILLAADAVGGGNRLFDVTVEYVKFRHQFGGPIGRFQGIKHQLANLLTQVEPMRSLLWYAAHACDRTDPQGSRLASIAKAHATEVFMTVAREAVQLHGGMGYTWESDVQIWLKRAIADFALMGTPARHRARAAELAGW